MKFLKFVLAAAAVVFAAVLAFLAVGVIVNVIWCLFLLAALYVAGSVAVKLLRKPERPRLEEERAGRELVSAERVLKEYKRKVTSGD